MKISAEQYERLNQFLDASMNLEQMELFEKELEASPGLRQQLDFEQAVRDSFHSKQVPVETPELVTLTSIKHRPNIFRNKWVAVAAAASIVGIIISITLIKPGKKGSSDVAKNGDVVNTLNSDSQLAPVTIKTDSPLVKDLANLYATYFEMDRLPDDYPVALADAFTGYENGDYKKVINLDLARLTDTRGADDEQSILLLGHYYKGLALLKTTNTREAIKQLEWVTANGPGNVLQQKATWYIALAQLKSDNNLAAIYLLKKIEGGSGDSAYKIKARKLLQDLK